jgi:LysR family transcriptional regulator, nitrogen assimilation regulatory protein
VDVRQLRYFLGVVEARSLNKASLLLHIAQPALSSQIRNLEYELGVKLLHRHARGVAPTEAGERLAKHADQVLRDLDRMRQDLSDYATAPSGRVVISAARSIPHAVTAAIVERCQARFPEVRLRVLDGWWKAAADGLEVDLALTFNRGHDVSFVYEPLVHDELVFVCPAKERWRSDEIEFGQIIQQTLILPTHRHYTRQLLETVALLAERQLKISYEIDSFEATKELVGRGLGKTVMPIACVHDNVENGKLRTIKIRNRRFERTLYLMHSSRQERSSVTDLVSGEVRSIIMGFVGDGTFGWRKLLSAQPSLQNQGPVAA